MRKRNGFTIMELLVVFILALVLFGIVLGGNYYFQMKKGFDSRRKQDMAAIQRMLEDYYADNNRYPAVSEMTYETQSDTPNAGKICGSKYFSPSLRPYVKELSCSWDSPLNDYIYFIANDGQDYAIFTKLANDADADIEGTGCTGGCSYYTNPLFPASTLSVNYYNYQVHSSSYVIINCDPTEFIACFVGAGSPCQRCPFGNCSGYNRLYCTSRWCRDNCR